MFGVAHIAKKLARLGGSFSFKKKEELMFAFEKASFRDTIMQYRFQRLFLEISSILKISNNSQYIPDKSKLKKRKKKKDKSIFELEQYDFLNLTQVT